MNTTTIAFLHGYFHKQADLAGMASQLVQGAARRVGGPAITRSEMQASVDPNVRGLNDLVTGKTTTGNNAVIPAEATNLYLDPMQGVSNFRSAPKQEWQALTPEQQGRGAQALRANRLQTENLGRLVGRGEEIAKTAPQNAGIIGEAAKDALSNILGGLKQTIAQPRAQGAQQYDNDLDKFKQQRGR